MTGICCLWYYISWPIMNIEQPIQPPALSPEEEEDILNAYDRLNEGNSEEASEIILVLKDKIWKNLKDYRQMFSFMRGLKRNGRDLTFCDRHKCGDGTVFRLVKAIRKAKKKSDLECLFMTYKGMYDGPISEDARINNTDLFTHYLEALFLAIPEEVKQSA